MLAVDTQNREQVVIYNVRVKFSPNAPAVRLDVDAEVDRDVESFGSGRGGRETFGVTINGYSHPRTGRTVRINGRHAEAIERDVEQQIIDNHKHG